MSARPVSDYLGTDRRLEHLASKVTNSIVIYTLQIHYPRSLDGIGVWVERKNCAHESLKQPGLNVLADSAYGSFNLGLCANGNGWTVT